MNQLKKKKITPVLYGQVFVDDHIDLSNLYFSFRLLQQNP